MRGETILLRGKMRGLRKGLLAIVVLALVFFALGAASAEAGVIFQSSWDAATGTSSTAINDGGKWTSGYGPAGILQQPYVSSGGPGGHNYLNMVTVGGGGWGNPYYMNWYISGGDIFHDPDDLYIRMYFRVSRDWCNHLHNETHWFSGIDNPNSYRTAHYLRFNSARIGELPNLTGDYTIGLGCGAGGGGNVFIANVSLYADQWYCFEVHIQKVSSTLERRYMRLDGVDITDKYLCVASDRNLYGTWLGNYYASGNALDNQYHGNLWPTTYDQETVNEGWDITLVEVRDDRWPGPIDGGAGGGADTTAPTPNPMTWAVAPAAAGATTISMTATTATDADSPPVSYYFDFISSPTGGTGGSDSSWQSSTSYADTGLQPNHQYSYQVRARDSASTPNETSASSPVVSRYTLANTPTATSFSNVTGTSVRANWTANGNRSGTQYYCENTSAGTNSGWTTNLYWSSSGLACGTNYNFRVKARNGDGTETAWTALGLQSTTACADTIPPTGSIEIRGTEGMTERTGSNVVTLILSASDTGSGMGSGAQMQFSNNGSTWSTAEPYATTKTWSLIDVPTGTEQIRTVYVRFKDVAGNWSGSINDTIILDRQPPSAPSW